MKKLFILLLSFAAISGLNAQNTDNTLFTIDGVQVSKQEFLKMYNKNNSSNELNKQDMEDYLDLYINYRLKLLQAKELGFDTVAEYNSEVEKYRLQITEPYINDPKIIDSLIDEAYQRQQEFLRASHILITLPANATPQDTLAAYEKALMIREKALKGEDFSLLATEYSDDPSTKGQQEDDKSQQVRGNGGDLGYFTSMTMVYPFESACYGLKEGEISMPVRSAFGYHIIKLYSRIPAFFYTANMHHIWISNTEHSNEDCKDIVYKAYNLINEVGFDSVARLYSDDKYSAANGGMILRQRPNNIPAEYVDKMAVLEPFHVSEPFETRFGWHIIKYEQLEEIPPIFMQRQQILTRISKDSRGHMSLDNFAETSKQDYNFRENTANIKELTSFVTDSVFSANWQIPENINANKTLFVIGDTSFSQKDYLEFLYTIQRKQSPQYLPLYIENTYKDFASMKSTEYGREKLTEKYPELGENIADFRNGVYIFALMDQMVWNKSLTDTVGLQEFYRNNKTKYNWNTRVEATIWTIDTSLDFNKALKIITKANKKNLTAEQTKKMLIEKFKLTGNTDKYIYCQYNRYEKGDNTHIDNHIWNKTEVNFKKDLNLIKIDTTTITNKDLIIVAKRFIAPEQKTLSECKGLATSDYQTILENQWIKDLRDKHTISINQSVFDSLFKK